MLISLHLLRRVCKAASAALWTLMQGSCRSSWSPEMERMAKPVSEECPGLSRAVLRGSLLRSKVGYRLMCCWERWDLGTTS